MAVAPLPRATLADLLTSALLLTVPLTLEFLTSTEPMLAFAPLPRATLADLLTSAWLLTVPLILEFLTLTEPMLASAPFPSATLADLFTIARLDTVPLTSDPAKDIVAPRRSIPVVIAIVFFIFIPPFFYKKN